MSRVTTTVYFLPAEITRTSKTRPSGRSMTSFPAFRLNVLNKFRIRKHIRQLLADVLFGIQRKISFCDAVHPLNHQVLSQEHDTIRKRTERLTEPELFLFKLGMVFISHVSVFLLVSYVPGLSSESFCPVRMAASIFLFDTFLPTEEFDFGSF